MTQEDLLNRLENEVRDTLYILRNAFVPHSGEALKHRNTPESWHALECFAHLNAYFEAYLPGIEQALHKAKARAWTPGGDIRYTARGKRLLRRVDPGNPKKYKSSEKFNFSHQPLGEESLKTLIIQCERLLRSIESARTVDINRPKIKKAKAWFGYYTLANLLEWLSGHARKHVEQAVNAVSGG